MPASLFPSLIVSGLPALTPHLLQQKKIDLLLLDFDNTIVPYTTSVPTGAMDKWFAAMREGGISICVVSNSRKPRVQIFCRQRGIPCVTSAHKPFTRGIREAMGRFSADGAHTALAGDQIFTDVLGANRAGIRSILVTPIALNNPLLWARHQLEKPVIAAAKRRRT